MTVAKLKRPSAKVIRFRPSESPFVWFGQITFIGYTQPTAYDSDFDFTIPTLNIAEVEVGQIFVDAASYSEVSTVEACNETEFTWYYNSLDQKIYIHIDHTKRMVSSTASLTKTSGYCNEQVFYDEDDIEYLPLMMGSVFIQDEADRLVYNKMSFITNSFSFDNSDADFDDFIDSPVPGADVNILYISSKDLESGSRILTPVYTGFADSDNISQEDYNVSVLDKRSQLNVDVPNKVFAVVDYPSMKSKYEGDVIPEGYGSLKGIPAIPLNGEATGNLVCKYATDGTSLATVYADIDDEWVVVTPVSSDPTNGEVTLLTTDVRKTNGTPYNIKVDCVLRPETSPGDIIKDMLDRYVGRSYISEFYNFSQWESEASYLADVYLYMNDSQPVFEYIETLQNASDYGFRFFIDANGKFSLKVDDINRATSRAYLAIDNISDVTQSERDFTDYATSVRVNYLEDIEDEAVQFTVNTDYETEAIDTYRYEHAVTFDSNLLLLADAENKAARIALDYSMARNKITFTIDALQIQEIYDIITIDTSEYSGQTKTREYMGVRKLKVSGYEYDFETEQTTITGYDITEVS